jgi:hypothetical protein
LFICVGFALGIYLWPSLEKVFRSPNSPPLRRHHSFILVSEPSLAHLKLFSFTAK